MNFGSENLQFSRQSSRTQTTHFSSLNRLCARIPSPIAHPPDHLSLSLAPISTSPSDPPPSLASSLSTSPFVSPPHDLPGRRGWRHVRALARRVTRSSRSTTSASSCSHPEAHHRGARHLSGEAVVSPSVSGVFANQGKQTSGPSRSVRPRYSRRRRAAPPPSSTPSP
jgi:hypothetical protein